MYSESFNELDNIEDPVERVVAFIGAIIAELLFSFFDFIGQLVSSNEA